MTPSEITMVDSCHQPYKHYGGGPESLRPGVGNAMMVQVGCVCFAHVVWTYTCTQISAIDVCSCTFLAVSSVKFPDIIFRHVAHETGNSMGNEYLEIIKLMFFMFSQKKKTCINRNICACLAQSPRNPSIHACPSCINIIIARPSKNSRCGD